MNDLRLLALNLTERCNLACAHCYLDAGIREKGGSAELETAEVRALLDEVVTAGHAPMVVLTGGEPLLRRDLETIVAHGAGHGLPMVIGTNGLLLSPRRVETLQNAGLLGVGISVDSLVPERHDGFRGRPGAWRRTMAGIEACRNAGLSFQVHFSVTEQNAVELEAVVDFACAAGARVLNVFFLVCTGRGERMSDISPERYEEVLNAIIDVQSRTPEVIVRARCAPHFKRIAHQRDPDAPLNHIAGRDGDGCIAAAHYCRVTPEGNVTACPYLPEPEGSIREQAFCEIWEHAPGLQRLRAARLGGRCGECEYRRLCGGCRARAAASTGDVLGADPTCRYAPAGSAVIVPFEGVLGRGLSWTPEAKARLERVPRVLRALVERRAEAYVTGNGESVVTARDLHALAARRFGGRRPDDSPRGEPFRIPGP